MKLQTLEAIFRAFADAEVRYLVVGGVAVNIHGYPRATQDLDLVVKLESANVLAALRALAYLGYRPLLPVRAEDFADEETRREWREDRNVEVFSMVSDDHADTTVDLFATEPFPFDEELEGAFLAELSPDLSVPCVRLDTLIAMKEALGRARDRDDVEQLAWIREERGEGGP